MKNTLERDHPDIICEVLAGTNTRPVAGIAGASGLSLLAENGPQQRENIVPGDEPCLNYWFTLRDDAEIARLTKPARR